MKIIIFGGDGFCGWPTALHLSENGHDVVIVDNLSRRNIDNELGANSLTPISSIQVRIEAWKDLTGKNIGFLNLDISKDYQELLQLFIDFQPDSIIHFAEQRAAPYSMKSSFHKRYTVDNNINATHNILVAIAESSLDVHVIHLGTMGVYGYGTAGMKIPEGYLNIEVELDDGTKFNKDILYPANPGSVYHMTKTQDQLMFFYYNNNDEIRITDLHQGVVWGTQTRETKKDIRLINRFDYDGDYGTVLNRFLMQSATGYPLTVYGSGGQTRAFIHIQDTVECIRIALENPPKKGDRVQIYNQMTETHRVRDLAKIVSKLTKSKIEYIKNPRNEDSENELHVDNDQFLAQGLNPITLDKALFEEVTDIVQQFSGRCNMSTIECHSYWNNETKK